MESPSPSVEEVGDKWDGGICGTAPTPESADTVFADNRQDFRLCMVVIVPCRRQDEKIPARRGISSLTPAGSFLTRAHCKSLRGSRAPRNRERCRKPFPCADSASRTSTPAQPAASQLDLVSRGGAPIARRRFP